MAKIYFFLTALVIFATLSLAWGQYEIDLSTLAKFLQAKLSGEMSEDLLIIDSIITQIRLPRVLLAMLIGASLSVSGVVFQAMFTNPLVSPGILGVLAGASFGAALGMVVSDSWLAVQLLSFAFGFLAVGAALFISFAVAKDSSKVMLVLGGVISGSLFTALLSILKYTADPYSTLPAIVYWLMGSLSMAKLDEVLLISIPMVLSIVAMITMGKHLDLLSLGDEEAKAMGVDVRRVRIVAILLATLASSLSVVMAGVIGWVGLIVPHIVRFYAGASHRVLLPLSAIIGALFLLTADNISRLLLSVEIPIGILTSLVGIPIFVLVLKKAGSRWS
ncbi:MAG: iron ABC transporter permease [Sulfuricurvum sp.]